MRAPLIALLALGLLDGARPAGADGLFWLKPEWSTVRERIRKEYPAVPQLATRDLAAWLAAKDRAKPLLLDVRTWQEFATSHLAGAQRVDPDAKPAQLDLRVAKDQPIVTYCSVGYRSSAMAARLRAAGFTNVQNLEGSIFQWANEDRPLVSDGEPTKTVHPFNASWGHLLKPEHRGPMVGPNKP